MGSINKYKDLITGKSLKKAEGVLDRATSRLTNPANGGRSTLNQSAHMDRLNGIVNKTRKATNIARGATAGVGIAGAGTAGLIASNKEKTAGDIVDERFEKIAANRDDDTETRVWRDRIRPEIGRGLKTLGGIIPVGAAMGIYNAKKGIVPGIGQTAAISLAGAGINGALRSHDLNKLNKKYLDEKASTKDHVKTQLGGLANYAGGGVSQVAPLAGLGGAVAGLGTTPEAIVQKKRRLSAADNEKTAGDIVDERFEKIAQAIITQREESERGLSSPVPKAEITKKEESERGLSSPVPKAEITKKEEEERARKSRDLSSGAGIISTKQALGQKTAMDIVNDTFEKM